MIYVVIGIVGEYSERDEWCAAAAADQELARHLADAAGVHARALHQLYESRWDADDPDAQDRDVKQNPDRYASPWDTIGTPEQRFMRFTGPATYIVAEVPVYTEPPE